MWLNEAAHSPNSSLALAGRRVSSRPSASDRAAALAPATGASVRRASRAPTTPESAASRSQPAMRMLRSWSRSAHTWLSS